MYFSTLFSVAVAHHDLKIDLTEKKVTPGKRLDHNRKHQSFWWVLGIKTLRLQIFVFFHVPGKGISLLHKSESCLWETADFLMHATRKWSFASCYHVSVHHVFSEKSISTHRSKKTNAHLCIKKAPQHLKVKYIVIFTGLWMVELISNKQNETTQMRTTLWSCEFMT